MKTQIRWFLPLALGVWVSACAHNARTETVVARRTTTITTVNRGPVAANATSCVDTPVFFASNSADLDPQSQQRLDEVSACMRTGTAHSLIITGRADPRGTEQANQDLGMRRASSVADYMRQRGITNTQITVQSWGEVGQSDTPLMYQFERNAHVVVRPR